MSNSHRSLESMKSCGNYKAPERANFVNTCNLLSQYLKEKGGLKDLNREISGKLESIAKAKTTNNVKAATTTKDLLCIIEDLNHPPTQQSPDELPRFEPTASSSNPENLTNKATTTTSEDATMEPKTAQLTILYEGKIWVFDGLSPEKAGEVMLFASKGSSHWSGGNLLTSGEDKINPAVAVASSSAAPVNPASSSGKQHVQPQLDANSSDLPIARRSSLHRFLEKRKDRAIAAAPYQVRNAPASSSKNDDQQLELKL